jgi:hypothetical protein
MDHDYARYKLRENPFPQNATIDVDSDDVRTNGTIFCQDVFEKELESIKREMEFKTNMMYISGLQYERGVGKSAVMAHFWRELSGGSKLFTAFIKCAETGVYSRPAGFCKRIIEKLHERGYLWSTFLKILLKYAEETGNIVKEAVEIMSEHYKRPPEKLPLERYVHAFEPSRLINDIIYWAVSKCGCKEHLPEAFFNTYFTYPTSFLQKASKGRFDPIEDYEDTLKLLRFAGFEYGYFFLNQFEWSIPSSANIKEFCIGMRRMLEASENTASIIVTLHPEAYKKLADNPLAEHLRTLAPFDNRHYKVLNVLPRDGKLGVHLAETYVSFFRTEALADKTYPFEPLTIRYLCFLYGGNIRDVLQALYQCVEFAIEKNCSNIDMKFLMDHHQEVLGRDFNQRKYKEFREIVSEE